MNTIMLKNLNFSKINYTCTKGVVSVNLKDPLHMKAEINLGDKEWSIDYAEKHLKQVLYELTGVSGGWTIPFAEIEFGKKYDHYSFSIKSKLYEGLRKIYDRIKITDT